jgi:hypothetical protein
MMTFPWNASYGVSLKIVNNSANGISPLLLRARRKTEKEIRLKSVCAGKNKNRFSHFPE